MRPLIRLLVALALLAACRQAETTRPVENTSVFGRVDDRFRLQREVAPRPPELPASPWTAPPAIVARFDDAGMGLRPVFRDDAPREAHPAEVTLPATADGAFLVHDRDTGVELRARLLGAEAVSAVIEGDRVAYPGAFAGADVVHRLRGDGTEDYLWITAPDTRVAYELEAGRGVAGLRLVEDTLELVDARGAPRLRISPPYLVGADGRTQRAHLAVDGCRYDTNPVGPWDRPVTPPGAKTCQVRVTWAADGLKLPALLDPSWTTAGNLASARTNHVMLKLGGGKVFAYGGWNGSVSLSTAELFDPGTATWASTGGWFPGRNSTGSIVLPNGNVFISGGFNESASTNTLQSTGIYSPSSGTFTTFGVMGTPRRSHTLTRIADGRLLLAGGYNSSWSAKAELYDPVSMSSVPVGDLGTARWRHTATLLPDGKVVVIGGTAAADIRSMETFDPASSTWTQRGLTSVAHLDSVSTMLPNGYLLVAGGDVLPGAEIVDIGTWTTVPMPINTRLYKDIAMTDLGGGSILLTGGLFTGGTWRFDGVTGTLATDTTMNVPRGGHGAVLLDDARVLVAGGRDVSVYRVQSELLGALRCSNDAQCPNAKSCVDGFCCNTACAGACDRCDVFNAEGTCTNLGPGSAGSPSCAPYVCNGIQASCPGTCTSDTDCASGNWCNGGSCVARTANGATCSTSRQCLSGNCVDGYCCNASCGGGCDRCDVAGSLGTCTLVSGPSAACGNYLCSGSSASCSSSCTSDAGCTSGNICYASTCQAPRPQGSSCLRGADCQSTFCADGVCCDGACGGSCDACNLSGSLGKCAFSAGTGGSPSCGNYLCSGTSASCPTSCTVDGNCASGSYCAAGSCVPKKSTGATCAAANECSTGNCADGYCCTAPCNGACDRCDGPGAQGTCTLVTGDATCAPYRCSGSSASCTTSCTTDTQCATNAWCNGSSCAARFALGTSCSRSAQCLSGNCIDGYCCDTGCSGACDQCNLPGKLGTCSPLASGTPSTCGVYVCTGDSGVCPTSCGSDVVCATGYACANGACVPATPNGASCSTGAPCISGLCVDGVCCNTPCAGACDQCNLPGTKGTCTYNSAGTVSSCAPYTCSGFFASCPASCATDADCTAGNYCSGGGCVPKKANGVTCGRDGDCASGACADGVCCNTTCAGACDRCNQTASVGTCLPMPAGSVACGNYLCAGAATCPASCASDADCATGNYCGGSRCQPKLPQGGPCTRDPECTNGRCVDGRCCSSACGGGCDRCDVPGFEGTCSNLPAFAIGQCPGYVCKGGAACPTSCTSDQDCQSTHFCFNATCTPKRNPGGACTADTQCASGPCVDGVCCNNACTGACDRCDVFGFAGTCTFVGATTTCGAYRCSGSSASCPGACTSDANCSPGNYCAGGQCVPQLATGTSCPRGTACSTGYCVDGVCCENACTGACDRCDAAPGRCLPSEAGLAGTCGRYVCDGTTTSCPTSCTIDTNCATGSWCSNGQCVAKQANGASCAAGGSRSCVSGQCVDGVCCNSACAGSCDRCDLSGSVGTCAPEPAGTLTSCGPYACDGASGSCPASCTQDQNCAPGFACRGGACVANTFNGDPCASAAQCTSGVCWNGACCESACAGGCETCQQQGRVGQCVPLAKGPSRNAVCAPFLCNGSGGACPTNCATNADCAAGAFCDANHRCTGTFGPGHACANDGECGSQHCADGVCCNSACGSACDRCDLAGAVGRCVPASRGTTSPDPACRALCDGVTPTCPLSCRSGADCAAGNWCHAGSCEPVAGPGSACTADAGCATGHCVDGVCCDTTCANGCDRCDLRGTAGTCQPVPAGVPGANPACGNYLCDGARATCPASCTSDGDCAAGSFCSGSRCVPKLGPGAACIAARQCASNTCVDGVCCDRGCDGQCEACNVPGKLGRCSPVVGNPVGGRPACAGATGDACRGACDGRSGSTCTYPARGFTCREPACTQGTSEPRESCDGAGACVAEDPVSCGPYACDAAGTACRTSCEADADCADGFHCAGGLCMNDLGPGAACRLGAECASGFCADGVCCNAACGGGCDRCDLAASKGTCTPVTGALPGCAPYLCNGVGGACPDRCENDAACAGGFRCLHGACTAPAGPGERCGEDRACASGFCVDGVCCDGACEGSCASCALPGKEGTCTLVVGGAAPGRPACGGEGLCGGSCDGSGPECSFPDTSTTCAPGFCTESAGIGPSSCDGHGACRPAEAKACAGGCEAGRCLGTAAADGCASAGGAGLAAIAGLVGLLGRRRRRG